MILLTFRTYLGVMEIRRSGCRGDGRVGDGPWRAGRARFASPFVSGRTRGIGGKRSERELEAVRADGDHIELAEGGIHRISSRVTFTLRAAAFRRRRSCRHSGMERA